MSTFRHYNKLKVLSCFYTSTITVFLYSGIFLNILYLFQYFHVTLLYKFTPLILLSCWIICSVAAAAAVHCLKPDFKVDLT